MPSGTEKDILKFIDQEGGETSIGAIRSLLACYGSDYVRTVCGSLGRQDYLDWFKDGTIRLTDKGWKALGKEPQSPWKNLKKNWRQQV